MPLHRGHLYLMQSAAALANNLTVVVDVPDEDAPLAIAQRIAWVKELMPQARVLAIPQPLPQAPDEHPDFWALWRDALQALCGACQPDLVVASEAYGQRLADELGAKFIPLDQERQALNISATTVRRDPRAAWAYLPDPVRAYYAKRVAICGPESTGKSTLARRIAEAFGATLVPEYARSFLEQQSGELRSGDIHIIAHCQAASEDALARQSSGLLICDTDPLASVLWNQRLGRPEDHDAILVLAQSRHYDLTILCDVDVPWVDDVVRYLPDDRQAFLKDYQRLLEVSQRPYVLLSGTWEERWGQVLAELSSRHLV